MSLRHVPAWPSACQLSFPNATSRTDRGLVGYINWRVKSAIASLMPLLSKPSKVPCGHVLAFACQSSVIPNPVSIETSLAQRSHQNPTGDSETHQLIAVGRLTPQKGFDLLIKSFAALAPKHPKWRLTIYGEGPERGILELLKAEERPSGQIELPGIRRDLLSALREGSLFVLPSRFEGYPNALLEALACGLP